MEKIFIDKAEDVCVLSQYDSEFIGTIEVYIKDIEEEFEIPSNLKCDILDIEGCPGLKAIPSTIQVKNCLALRGSHGVKTLPDGFSCRSLILENVHNLPLHLNVDNIILNSCDIETFDVMGEYVKVAFVYCKKLKHVCKLTTEMFLVIQNPSLENIDEVTATNMLVISGADNLTSANVVNNNNNYDTVVFELCPKITDIPTDFKTDLLGLVETGIPDARIAEIKHSNICNIFATTAEDIEKLEQTA